MIHSDIPRKTVQRENLLTPNDVSKWLGVSAGWVRDHATRRQPRLPSVRLGKLLRFRATEIEQFLLEQGIAA